MNSKPTLSLFTLLSIATLISLLLAALPQTRAQAIICMECHGGGDPTEPPGGDPDPDPDPGPEPTDPPDDDPDPTDEPPLPTEPPCDPYYDPPSILAVLTLDPPYPITLGQDPDDHGVDVSGITAMAGMRHCPNGRAQIVSFRVVQVRLAQSSIAWITGELARKYPGAHVKGAYPFTPAFQVNGLGTPTARLSFHLAPLDPGYYEVTVQATQSDGQSVTQTLRVPVYLLESTIIQ